MDNIFSNDINILIDKYFLSFYEKIGNDLQRLLDRHDRFLLLNLEKLKGGRTERQHGESKKDYIKRVFKEDPLCVINNLIDEMEVCKYQGNMKIEPRNVLYNYQTDRRFFIREKILLSNLKYLTYADNLSVRIKSDFIDTSSAARCKISIDDYNSFTSEVTIFGEIELLDIHFDEIEYFYLDISFEYIGLTYKNSLPVWIEYLIEGAIYQSMDNSNLSIFNYFVAFDWFTQTMYNQIHKYYSTYGSIQGIETQLNNHIESIKDVEIDVIINTLDINDDLEDEDVYDRICNEVQEEYSQEIADEIKDYTENYEHILSYCKLRLEEEYKSYAKQDKRLIKEKLKDVEHVLGIDLNTSQFSGLSKLKGRLKAVEKCRNSVAHGNTSHIKITGFEFYEIATYILSIILHTDLDRTYWNDLIQK